MSPHEPNPHEQIENRTFDEIAVGDSASQQRTLTRADIDLFGIVSGDLNPAHFDEDYAQGTMFKGTIAHGMLTGALISAVLGMQMPGPGAIYLGQSMRFRRPVRVGDTITTTVTAQARDEARKRITFACACTNQDGETVVTGEAELLVPTEKIVRPRPALPQVTLTYPDAP